MPIGCVVDVRVADVKSGPKALGEVFQVDVLGRSSRVVTASPFGGAEQAEDDSGFRS